MLLMASRGTSCSIRPQTRTGHSRTLHKRLAQARGRRTRSTWSTARPCPHLTTSVRWWRCSSAISGVILTPATYRAIGCEKRRSRSMSGLRDRARSLPYDARSASSTIGEQCTPPHDGARRESRPARSPRLYADGFTDGAVPEPIVNRESDGTAGTRNARPPKRPGAPNWWPGGRLLLGHFQRCGIGGPSYAAKSSSGPSTHGLHGC